MMDKNNQPIEETTKEQETVEEWNNEQTQSDTIEEEVISEEELAQLPTVSKKVYWLLYALIAVLLLGLIAGTYRFFPFFSKINGSWESEEYSTYRLDIEGDRSTFTVSNIQSSSDIDMLFEGDLTRTGSNRYRVENVEVFLEFNKEGFSEEDIETLKAQEDLYELAEENEDTLKLKYTDEAVDVSFNAELDRMFYYTLENFEYGLFGQEIRVRNESLSPTSFVMTQKDSE